MITNGIVLEVNGKEITEPVLFIGLKKDIGVAYPCTVEGYFSYFAGAKHESPKVPDDFIDWELPMGAYIVCSFEAENFEALVMDALYKAQVWRFGLNVYRKLGHSAPFFIESENVIKFQ